MYKKPFLAIPVLMVFLSVSVCFAAVNTSLPANRNITLQAAQDKITALIDAKDFAAAQAAIDKMAVDFAGNELLGRQIWEDANRYDKREAFEYAKALCTRVVADYPADTYASSYASLLLAKLEIYDSISTGDYTSADSAVAKMLDDFAGHSQLARRTWEVANRYDKVEAFVQSKQLCKQIVSEFPDDEYTTYAALQLAKLDAFELINTGKYEDAQEKALAIIKDFKGHKQQSRRLWELANRYDKFKIFNYSKQLCEQIVANCPNDEYTTYAALQLAKLKIYELINAGKYEDANSAVSDIIKGFKGHKQHSRRLYEIAQKFAENGAKVYASQLHGRIAADYPDDKYGLRAAVQHKKLEAYSQIDANDLQGAQQTVSQMKADFADTDELYAQLESIGVKYDIIGKADEAKKIFQEIIQNFPPDGDRAVLATAKAQLTKYELFSAIESGNDTKVRTIISQLGSQLGDNEKLDMFLNTVGGSSYSHGNLAKKQGDADLAIGYFEAAIGLWERVFTQHPDSPLAAGACFSAAAQLAQELGDYAGAVEYFQKVVNDWPGFENVAWAQLKVGIYLEEQVNVGELATEDARPLLIEAYQKVIDNYPKSEWVDLAQRSLERLNKEK